MKQLVLIYRCFPSPNTQVLIGFNVRLVLGEGAVLPPRAVCACTGARMYGDGGGVRESRSGVTGFRHSP